MAYPNTFTDLLEDDEPSALFTREYHLNIGLAFLMEAESQMVNQIKANAGSVNPPHALAFANAHLLAAQVITQVESA